MTEGVVMLLCRTHKRSGKQNYCLGLLWGGGDEVELSCIFSQVIRFRLASVHGTGTLERRDDLPLLLGP